MKSFLKTAAITAFAATICVSAWVFWEPQLIMDWNLSPIQIISINLVN